MQKHRFSAHIEGSLCTDFIFTKIESSEPNVSTTYVKQRDVTILLNDRLTSQFDPVRLKQACTPRQDNDAAYQSLSDDQKFDCIKPRVIQQPADLEKYNEILQNNAEQIKATARDSAERAQVLHEIAQTTKGNVSRGTTEQQNLTE